MYFEIKISVDTHIYIYIERALENILEYYFFVQEIYDNLAFEEIIANSRK